MRRDRKIDTMQYFVRGKILVALYTRKLSLNLLQDLWALFLSCLYKCERKMKERNSGAPAREARQRSTMGKKIW